MISCGIDFGTSNSAIAVSTGQDVRLSPIEDGNATIPSAIFYHVDGTPVYGRDAEKSFFQGDDGRFMRSFKRTLGTDLIDFGAIISGKLKKYDHIIAGFIRQIKMRAEQNIDNSIDNVVMGRPVHFVDGNKSADTLAQTQLESIARLVGFKNIEFQFEPIAAAFAHERNITGERLSLVADIGGGTSDFSVIRLSDKDRDRTDRKNDILSNAGTRIGGNDFDKSFCLTSFMPDFGYKSSYGSKNFDVPLSWFHEMSEWSKINFLYTPQIKTDLRTVLKESHAPQKLGRYAKVLEKKMGHRLLSVVEHAKINLTEKKETTEDLSFIENEFSITATLDQFERSISEHIERISETISSCLALAEVQQNQIELIVLTGGPTETPLIKRLIKRRFPTAVLSEENKLSSVALGLGYDSQRRFQ